MLQWHKLAGLICSYSNLVMDLSVAMDTQSIAKLCYSSHDLTVKHLKLGKQMNDWGLLIVRCRQKAGHIKYEEGFVVCACFIFNWILTSNNSLNILLVCFLDSLEAYTSWEWACRICSQQDYNQLLAAAYLCGSCMLLQWKHFPKLFTFRSFKV